MTKNSIKLSKVSVAYNVRLGTRSSLNSEALRLIGIEKDVGRSHMKLRALADINISIHDGERVGIIGRNGAGKSTLLKTIAGTINPYTGLVAVNGQLQSLFDIGIGMEQNATGRENILYRGLIQGLSPKVIKEREEEIINFADLGRFIDMPIKTYSSGMTVRLAFAISAFLEGEILLVDEIFGAGDATFQAKANAKMMSIVKGAGIFVFTSHNLSLVSELCNRGIYLRDGRIAFDGPVDKAIDTYLNEIKS